jgi:mannose-6-phosphate isomerase class I
MTTAAWKQCIGNWRYRTLISEECESLHKGQGLQIPSPGGRQVGEQSPYIWNWPEEPADYFGPVQYEQLQNAVLILLGGRRILVGAPQGITQAIQQDIRSKDDYIDRLPTELILLSAEKEHVEGLGGLCDFFSQENKPLCVWTSNWIFESITSESQDKEHMLPEAVSDKNKNTLQWELFEERRCRIFAPQMQLELYYEVAGSNCPRLHAQFQQFSSLLTVRIGPYGFDPTDDTQLLPRKNVYQERCLKPLFDRTPHATTILAKEIADRFYHLMEAELSSEKLNKYCYTLQAEDHLTPKASGSLLSHVQMIPPTDRIEQRKDTGHVWANPTVSISHNNQPPEMNDDQSPKMKPLHLAIACGGLPVRSWGEVRPETRISLSAKVSGGKTKRLNESLLGLKVLDYLLTRFGKKEDTCVFSDKLLLMTSPWTERSVRFEIARLQDEYKNLWEGVTPIFIRQNIVPLYDEKGRQAFQWTGDGRGEFLYAPAGHLDFLLRLLQIGPNGNPLDDQLESDSMLYFCNYNNLGRNLDARPQSLARQLEERKGKGLPFIAFELTPRDPNNKHRGSYWAEIPGAKQAFLVKPDYLEGPQEDWIPKPSPDQDDIATYMSSGSVVVDLKALQAHRERIERLPYYSRNVSSAAYKPFAADKDNVVSKNITRWERDIDQVSMFAPEICIGVTLQPDPQQESPSPRFFPIKEEKNLYESGLQVLNTSYSDICISRGETSSTPDRVLQTSVAPKLYAPWGGEEIRVFKGKAGSSETESESYEFSVYPRAVSLVAKDALHAIPLDQAINPKQVDVMAKLLDCNGWLSYQIHPNSWILGRIKDVLKEDNQAQGDKSRQWESLEKEELEAKDEIGKSETFYVVRAKEDAKLCLGFKRDEIKGIGKKLSEEKNTIDSALRNGQTAKETQEFVHDLIKNDSELFSLDWLVGEDGMEKIPEEYKQSARDRFQEELLSQLGTPLEFILKCRERHYKGTVLCGMILILAIKALQDTLKEKLPEKVCRAVVARNDASLYDDSLHDTSLHRFFYIITDLEEGEVVNVPAGTIHAAGPGLFLAEFSNQSDNTFRVFDHGREFAAQPRSMHHLLAAASLSDSSFIDKDNEGRLRKKLDEDQPFGDIPLRKIGPSQLKGEADKNSQGYNLPPIHEHGDIVLSIQGGVSIAQDIIPGQTNHNRRTIELPEAHAAYIPPDSHDFTNNITSSYYIKPFQRYTESACLITPAKSMEREAVLCATIGSTHFEFTYDSPNSPERIPKYYIWHEVLKYFASNATWGDRLPVFQEKLAEFIGTVIAKNPPKENKIRVFGLSWPGFLQKNNSDVYQLYSSVLSCSGVSDARDLFVGKDNNGRYFIEYEKEEKGGNKKGEVELVFDNPEFVMFDADVDLRAEIAEYNGKLNMGNNEPGMLLNFASGICFGYFDGEKEEANLEVNDRHIGYLGRMMWIDLHDRTWQMDEKWSPDKSIKLISEDKFTHESCDDSEQMVRMSDFLSTTGVILRFLNSTYLNNPAIRKKLLHSIGKYLCKYKIADCGNCCEACEKKQNKDGLEQDNGQELMKELQVLCDSLAGNDKTKDKKNDNTCKNKDEEKTFPSLLNENRALLNAIKEPVFDWINARAYRPETSPCRKFIREVAYDFASALHVLIQGVPDLKKCKRLVLGGYGGANFGRKPDDKTKWLDGTDSPSTEPEPEPEPDLFISDLCAALHQYETPLDIIRTAISRNPHRLIEVCRRRENKKKS